MTTGPVKNLSRRERRPSICLVTPYLPSVSETFIRAHLNGLPAEVVLVHGWRPSIGASPVLSWPRRASYKAWRMLTGASLERETTAAYLKAFRKTGARAVLAEYGPTGVQVMEACRRARIPLVVHFFGYDATQKDVLERHAETYPLMFEQAAAVVVVSRAMQRQLIGLGAPPEKVHYNPCVADCREFEVGDASARPPVFLAVGRFVEKKAPQITLKAFAKVHRACPEARLRMIGDGPLFEQCRRLASELGIEGAVTLLGAQSHEAVREEMQRARCFVQHSVEAPNGDCEGTPVGILEAGASGLPVVSTRHAGIPDVVVEEGTGLLVDEHDVEGMAAQMLRLAQDAALAGQLGWEARRHVEKHFSQEQSLERLWTIIESAIDGSERSRLETSSIVTA
ncbi:MAG TPA: glycosyltransferase [Pyrinomonadaceae bacterium]|jgi:glycosyltransferase involved in cell wall biosynthesis